MAFGIDDLLMLGNSAAQGIGNAAGSYAQAKSAEEQRRQAQQMMDNENLLRSDFATWLNSLNGSMNFQQLPNPNDYLGFDSLNKFYDMSKQNLNYTMGSQVADAQGSAGALAASRGMANPTAFVNYAGQGVRNSFAPQFGQLEASRAGAMNNQSMNLFQALTDMAKYRNSYDQNKFKNAFDVANFRLG